MYLHAFRDSIYRIFDFFGKKAPAINRITAWHGSLEYMQDRAIPWIENKMCNDLDRLPDNLAKTYRTFYNSWLTENHEKQPEHKKTECHECGGKGLLWFLKNENEINYEYSARCKSCENWRRIWGEGCQIPHMNIQGIVNAGRQISGPTLEYYLQRTGQKNSVSGPQDIKNLV